MNAALCFDQRLVSQAVIVPDALRHDLHLRCLLPYLSIFALRDRLLHGGEVLDRRGGIDAPDHLWQRWEAILIAYLCCEEAVNEAAQERSQATPELAMAPKPNNHPTLIGIRSRKGT